MLSTGVNKIAEYKNKSYKNKKVTVQKGADTMKLKKPNTKKAEQASTASEEITDGPKEVAAPKKRHKKRYILLYIAAIGFVFYAVITIINQNVRIAEEKAKLSELQQQINVIEIQSEYLEKVQNYKGKDLAEYMEKIAKEDLGYVGQGERIFINVAGN